MKQRHIREGDSLGDAAEVVIRGGDLDPEILRDDALRNYHVYGVYGISVFALRGATLDELAQQAPLVRFDRLTVLTAGAIAAVGLRLDPTGRNLPYATTTSPSTTSRTVSPPCAAASTGRRITRTMNHDSVDGRSQRGRCG